MKNNLKSFDLSTEMYDAESIDNMLKQYKKSIGVDTFTQGKTTRVLSDGTLIDLDTLSKEQVDGVNVRIIGHNDNYFLASYAGFSNVPGSKRYGFLRSDDGMNWEDIDSKFVNDGISSNLSGYACQSITWFKDRFYCGFWGDSVTTLISSDNNGNTWSKVTNFPENSLQVNDIKIFDDMLFITGADAGKELYVLSGDNNEITHIELPNEVQAGNGCTSIDRTSSGRYILGTYLKGIWYSDDLKTFTKSIFKKDGTEIEITNAKYVTAIGNNIVCTNDNSQFWIYYSNDNGETFNFASTYNEESDNRKLYKIITYKNTFILGDAFPFSTYKGHYSRRPLIYSYDGNIWYELFPGKYTYETSGIDVRNNLMVFGRQFAEKDDTGKGLDAERGFMHFVNIQDLL